MQSPFAIPHHTATFTTQYATPTVQATSSPFHSQRKQFVGLSRMVWHSAHLTSQQHVASFEWKEIHTRRIAAHAASCCKSWFQTRCRVLDSGSAGRDRGPFDDEFGTAHRQTTNLYQASVPFTRRPRGPLTAANRGPELSDRLLQKQPTSSLRFKAHSVQQSVG